MTVFQIESVTIPAGDCVSFEFEFENSDKSIPNLSDYKAMYVLSPYGIEEENVLSKSMTLKAETQNVFRVTLTTNDTIDLEGAYAVKLVLIKGSNHFKKARGVLNVLKDSDGVEVTY